MIKMEELRTEAQFEQLKKGDILIIEWKRKTPKVETFRIAGVLLKKYNAPEVLLNAGKNIYFNYRMFIKGESNVEDVMMVKNGK